MSDRVVQSDHVSHGTVMQSVHPYQSAWMAHWKHKASEPAETQGRNLLSRDSRHYELKEDAGDTKQFPLLSRPEVIPAISKFAIEFREVSEARTVNVMNDSLKTSSIKFREERLDSQPFPMFNYSRNKESALALKDDQVTICHGGVLRSRIDPAFTLGKSESHLPSMLVRAHPETESPSRECQFQPTGISWNPEQQVKSQKLLEKNSLAVSTSFQDYVGSSSKIVPYGCNSVRTPMQSFMCRQEENDQSSPIAAAKEFFPNTKYHSKSTCLVHEKKTESELNFGRYGTPLLRQNDVPLLLSGPSASNDQLPAFAGKQCQTIQDNSGIRLFPSWNTSLEAIKREKLYHDCHSLPRLPSSVQDVETMRICSNVDSVKKLSRGPPEFHQATHQFLITKKTGFNLSEGDQMFRESSASTKFKGKMFGEFLSLSPSFGFHSQHGLKLQSLGSSTDSEGKDDVRDVKTSAICIKNESSAETDTMEMDDIQKNHLSGVALSPSDKNITGVQNSATCQMAIASAREEIGGGLPNTEIPDINQELPAVPAVATSMGDTEASTSRTQSLDVDHLLSHTEHPTNSKSSACPDGPMGPEPSSRWVKRLKLSSSDSFAHGTKSSKMGEASSHEKVNKLFSKIMKCSITSSEPTVGRRQGKEQMALDQTAVLLKNGESSSTDSVRKGQDITLSHSWIQRWCRNSTASPQKKPEAVVAFEPQSSKATFFDFQKKEYPSIAAMALMGKAMSGFYPCELKKMGSFVVWSTKGVSDNSTQCNSCWR